MREVLGPAEVRQSRRGFPLIDTSISPFVPNHPPLPLPIITIPDQTSVQALQVEGWIFNTAWHFYRDSPEQVRGQQTGTARLLPSLYQALYTQSRRASRRRPPLFEEPRPFGGPRPLTGGGAVRS